MFFTQRDRLCVILSGTRYQGRACIQWLQTNLSQVGREIGAVRFKKRNAHLSARSADALECLDSALGQFALAHYSLTTCRFAWIYCTLLYQVAGRSSPLQSRCLHHALPSPTIATYHTPLPPPAYKAAPIMTIYLSAGVSLSPTAGVSGLLLLGTSACGLACPAPNSVRKKAVFRKSSSMGL